jgi:hypothetical protein
VALTTVVVAVVPVAVLAAVVEAVIAGVVGVWVLVAVVGVVEAAPAVVAVVIDVDVVVVAPLMYTGMRPTTTMTVESPAKPARPSSSGFSATMRISVFKYCQSS